MRLLSPRPPPGSPRFTTTYTAPSYTAPSPRAIVIREHALPYLPPEIWIMVLEALPPSFFQQDLGRLTVSRRWYSLAFPAFFTRVEYTPRVISRLVTRKSKIMDRSRAMLRKSQRVVNVVIEGIGPWCDPRDRCYDTAANLRRFCLMLIEFKELTTVCFTARWANKSWKADPLQLDYLPLRTIEPYISLLPQVKVLDLDLCGTSVTNEMGGPVHLCPYLRPLLCRLHSLRVRMRCICLDAVCSTDEEPISVGNLVLDLYLGQVSDVNPKLNSSMCCFAPNPWDWSSPIDELRTELQSLATRMPWPQRAEIVHLAPSGHVHTWDALTDTCVPNLTEDSRSFSMFKELECNACFAGNDWHMSSHGTA
ncbi:hypothetical protein B0T26DRAFT_641845 [Lasiosphaeria miniovina]|uniref:F-box domain-containing protein n=1 Tax=Lasiosphaeria miniovina TaxID=1954250 RepID=A0AA40E339_9PEZI|nr:uncharacterized protein B0T26DRAFT_641845 [Lasiosphaeria miniovina]KAK0723232.1 hypothetical protein B0T26DRAFT_641845 [Lasiosphaeria miniovina]